MTAPASRGWPGCHGVAVHAPVDVGLGTCRGRPIADVDLRLAAVPRHTGREIWRQSVAPAGASRGAYQRLIDHGDGSFTLELGDEARVGIALPEREVVVEPPLSPLHVQLVASFALPIVATTPSTLVLHAACAFKADRTVLIAGPGGSGKSTALISLLNAGWTPLSEDVCVIDMNVREPHVWPGPPWVRVLHGAPGPPGAQVAFSSSEKTAWYMRDGQVMDAKPLTDIVLLRPPGGEKSECHELSHPESVRELAPHAVCLIDQVEPGARLFGPVVQVAAGARVRSLRLPRRPAWATELVSIFDAL